MNGGKNYFFLADDLYVCSAQLIAVLRIGLRIKRNLLALCKRFIGSFVEWGGMPAVHKKPLTCLRIHLKRLLFSKYLKIIALTLQINPFIRQFMQNHTP